MKFCDSSPPGTQRKQGKADTLEFRFIEFFMFVAFGGLN